MIARLAALLLAFTMPTHAGPLEVTKSPRMKAIETRFNVLVIGILRTKERDYWCFLEGAPEPATIAKAFPVVLRAVGSAV